MKLYIPVDPKKELPGDYTIYRLEGEILSKRDVCHGKVRAIEITEEEIMEVIKSHELMRTDGVHIVMINGVFPEVYKSLATAITNLLKEER